MGWRAAGAAAGSALLALALYAGACGHGWALDDHDIVRRNPWVAEGEVGRLLRSDYGAPHHALGLYRPLVMLSYALDVRLAGPGPLPHHAVNVALHALNSALVALLASALTASAALGAGTGLLFAAHAVHSEAVASISFGRPEQLAALFLLCALLAHRAQGRRPPPVRRLFAAAGLAAFALALLSKESAIVLPAILVLHDWVYAEPGTGRSQALRRRAASYAAFTAVALGYLGLRFGVLGIALPPVNELDNPLAVLPAGWRIPNALHVAGSYLGLLLAPLKLSYDYSYAEIPVYRDALAPALVLAVLGALAVVALGLVLSRLSPHVAFGLGLTVLAFSVVSNLAVPIGTILGERLLYAPSIGFCLALVVLLERASRWGARGRGANVIFALTLAGVVGLHALRSVVRVPDWRDDTSIALHDVRVSPRSSKARNNAGVALLRAGQPGAALEHFQAAIEIGPPSYLAPLENAATALRRLGRTREALALYQEVLRRGKQDASLYNNLGYLLVEEEIDVARGVELLERARSLRPGDAEILDSLGWGYFKRGDLARAEALLRRSLELDPDGPTAAARREHLQRVQQAARAAERGGSAPPR